MLVALEVENFKSIREARLRLGAVTCLIGHNGTGKSNLFDAIGFLSSLADRSLCEAAGQVRRAGDRSLSPLDLVFQRDPQRCIRFSADMIVPLEVEDDFGLPAKPSITLLTYGLTLKYLPESDRLVVASESLERVKLGDFKRFTRFVSTPAFHRSVARGRRHGPLISTRAEDRKILLHGDGGSRGRPAPVGKSPLTVVGGTNTSDYPTVLAAKREMSSWRILHLEPSAMRTPDSRAAVPHVSASGARISATLNSLIRHNPNAKAEVLNRLRDLNADIVDLEVRANDARNQLALRARIRGVENWLYGRSLSDGTLRYLALAVMLVDSEDRALLCIEEPENGIHPSRVPGLIELLRDYAVDPAEAVAPDDNSLRQVIVNTHSPEVARQYSVDELVFVERALSPQGPISVFRPVRDTWRAKADEGVEHGHAAVPPASPQAVSDFIGGAPLNPDLRQLKPEFGSAW